MTKKLTAHKKLATAINHEPTVDIELITPEIADRLLANNFNNRKIKQKKVQIYTNQILAKKWQLNGDSIKICKDGSLLDGQHRLAAISNCQVSVPTVVVRNLSRDVFSTIDIGSVRTAKDYLFIEGYKYPDALAGSARIIEMFNVTKEMQKSFFKHNRGSVTLDRIIELVEENPDLYEAVQTCSINYSTATKLIGKSIAPALLYMFQKKDKNLAIQLFECLNTGAGMEKESVILTCREKMMEERRMSFSLRGGDEIYRMSLLIRTWNLLRDGFWDSRLVQHKDGAVPIIK